MTTWQLPTVLRIVAMEREWVRFSRTAERYGSPEKRKAANEALT